MPSDACLIVVSQVFGLLELEVGSYLNMQDSMLILDLNSTWAMNMPAPASMMSMDSRKCLVKVKNLMLLSNPAQKKVLKKDLQLRIERLLMNKPKKMLPNKLS